MNDKRKENDFTENMIKESLQCGFDISKSVSDTLNETKLEFTEFNFVDINHSELINFLKKDPLDYCIFTGGGILKKEILSTGIKFIHSHPGILPHYRGSTCFYYSIINEDRCGATVYVMNEGIDTGKIIYQKIFNKPTHIFVDDIYDPHIRAETLVDVFRNNLLSKKEHYDQKSDDGETYHIIHPVLKHIAILSCIAND